MCTRTRGCYVIIVACGLLCVETGMGAGRGAACRAGTGSTVKAAKRGQEPPAPDELSRPERTVGERPEKAVAAPVPPQLLVPAQWTTVRAPQVTLGVHVEDDEQQELSVRFYGRQMASVRPPDFTIVALPDTQYYSQYFPETFIAQTQWILDQREFLKIAYVAHLGDIVDEAYDLVQWENANAAMSLLDTVPTLAYGLAVGNHDQYPPGDPNGTSAFNTYFPYARYEGVVDWYGGHHGDDNDNHYVLFSAGGLDFIVIHLEYDVRAARPVLDWAGALLSLHVNRRAIVVAHSLITPGSAPSWSQQGQAVYDALKYHPNLFLMLCAHFGGESRRTDVFNGNVIHTLMSNYQGRPHGGDGWLRFMKFNPEANLISVHTYSPTLDLYEFDADSQFTLEYAMDTQPFMQLGVLEGVPSGSDVELKWSGVTANARHQWFAVVSDGEGEAGGAVWTFFTTWPLGDLNCDGALDFGDINPFVQYLADLAGWQARYPDCSPENGDINQDGRYPSFGDINPFVELLAGGAMPP